MTEPQDLLDRYIEKPWENRHLHDSYKNSFLNFANAPEYMPSEVLLGSLYRRIGLWKVGRDGKASSSLGEKEVGPNGTSLMRLIDKRRKKGTDEGQLSVEGWDRVINEVIRSPRTPKQKAKKFIQCTPVVPSSAAYSMAARLRGNPWNPGGLIQSSLCIGSGTKENASRLWHKLFRALDVGEEEDDVWAVFLEREFARWNEGVHKYEWKFRELDSYEDWIQGVVESGIDCPSQRFASDISHLIQAKQMLTRRQWTSSLESILRIGIGAHVLWIAKVNHELRVMVDAVLQGRAAPSPDEIKSQLSTGKGFWSYGQLVNASIKKMVRNYMVGRLALNMLLYRCGTIKELSHFSVNSGRPFRNIDSIHEFLVSLGQHLDAFDTGKYKRNLNDAIEADPRKMAIKQGVGKNLEEYLRHSLGQRETKERGLENYDQGYLFTRCGNYSRAPWIIGAGPVMILTLVHCCTSDGTGIRTVESLCNHLAAYGIRVGADEVTSSDLGTSLRALGLVIDSPDAEGGMVLLEPFGMTNSGGR